jgi:hypothetical protein
MSKTFAVLDDVLIERVFQPLSDLIWYRLGISKSAPACVCIDVASLAWIVSRARGLSDAVIGWNAGAAFLDLALLMLGLAALISLRALFRRAVTRKMANPLRQAMLPHRAVVLLMLASRLTQSPTFGLTDTADLAMLVSAASALYLGACVERPPVRRQPHALVAAQAPG